MKTVVELRKQRANLLENAKGVIAAADQEDRALTEEEIQTIDEAEARAEQLKVDIERRERLDRMSADVAPTKPESRDANYHPTRKTAETSKALFGRYIRQLPGKNDYGLEQELAKASAEELRASNDTTMNITTDADGGYAVPTGHYNGIIEKARVGNLMDAMGVMDIPGEGTTTNVPTDDESDDGQFVTTAESGAFDRDAPALSQVALTLVKKTKKVDLTYELLRDQTSRLETFIESYVGAGLAATHNALGFTEALANGTAALTLDSATAIGAAEIPELIYKIGDAYANRGNLVINMERATEGYLRGLSGNNFIFTPTPPGVPRVMSMGDFFGLTSYTNSNMGTLQASGKSLMVADWSYMGRYMDPVMTFVRDPYTRAGNGEVILYYHIGIDYGVLQADAFQYATHPTA